MKRTDCGEPKGPGWRGIWGLERRAGGKQRLSSTPGGRAEKEAWESGELLSWMWVPKADGSCVPREEQPKGQYGGIWHLTDAVPSLINSLLCSRHWVRSGTRSLSKALRAGFGVLIAINNYCSKATKTQIYQKNRVWTNTHQTDYYQTTHTNSLFPFVCLFGDRVTLFNLVGFKLLTILLPQGLRWDRNT